MPGIKERKKIIDHIYKAMATIDTSGHNAKIYKDMLLKMSDKEFDKFMNEFANDRKDHFYIEQVEYEREVTIDSIYKCADYMKVPLFEKVVVTLADGTQVMTPEPVPVGYPHIRRMPQTLLKKSSGSLSIEKRDPRTGQVYGDDKNARNSDMETFSMIAIGAKQALRELMGPRADDMGAKSQMYNDISKNGYFSLADLTNDTYNKVALNTLDTYYLMQGISTNLVSDLDKIPGPRQK